jgi:nucleoside-diphosphate-sugar epimerase
VPPLALVTGASGFVGSHLVEGLRERGWRVRALVRPTSSLSWLPSEGVDLVQWTVAFPESLEAALPGVDVVFHCAGVVRGNTQADYDRVNVEGTRHLHRLAAATPGIGRFVLVSSLAAGGPSEPGRPRTEDDPDRPISAYGRSKLDGEGILHAAAGAPPWTIVRPVAVYGPRDRSFLLLARFVARGWIPEVGSTPQPVAVIHVRDLVRGIVLAARAESAIGRTYYLADPEPTDWPRLGRLMADALGRKARTVRIPRAAVAAIGAAARLVTAPIRRANPLPQDRLRELFARAWTCDVSRAREDLGYTPEINLKAGIDETMFWYRDEGWL